ncbi:Acyl-CoA synthetase (AMP-forming)/AMP-acid ligase II [Rhodospirillaceae bacterium LM-1]|nr:Acyl-CoA synthetase (AMP-forming)/AMP-acid ligase II [Rhodospirillaceae bacterium LM-1]
MTNHLFDAIRSRMPGPDRVFATTADGEVLTYGGLLDLSARLAHVLAACNVCAGDRVLLQAEKSLTALVLYLACVRAGAVFLPLNPSYTTAELDYFLKDAEPGLVVCDPAREAFASERGIRTLTLDHVGGGSLMDLAQSCSADFRDASRDADDLAAILYTSGTTGRSKGAMLTHENLLSNAKTLAEIWRFSSQDALLHALPVYHSHGLFVATNTALISGASMIFLPRFDADQVVKHLKDATVMMGVPTFYTRLLNHPGLTQEAVRHMRLFISGSAPLLAETHRQWLERTGHAVLERYGLTETNMNTSNPHDGERRPGSVGFPLPGVDLRIVHAETGSPLPQGEIGMIEVKGPNVCHGYWRNIEKTQTEFREDGFFITGDLGLVDQEGYVHIVGRAKDLVITGGFNVYPKEVESEIDALPGVLESAVFGVAHPDLGEGVTAAVVSDGTTVLSETLILAGLLQRLAKFKLPKRVLIVDELPRNAMGKVQKNLLREQVKDIYRNDASL